MCIRDSIYYAGIDPATVARDVRDRIHRLPQHNPGAAHHAIATHSAELANERDGVHLALARPDDSQ